MTHGLKIISDGNGLSIEDGADYVWVAFEDVDALCRDLKAARPAAPSLQPPSIIDTLRAAEGAVEQLCEGQDPANECWVTLGEIRAQIKRMENHRGFILRKPADDFEFEILLGATGALQRCVAEMRHVNFVIPVQGPTRPDGFGPSQHLPYIYTVDREAVGHMRGRQILRVSQGKTAVLLICPEAGLIAEETK